MRLEKARQEEKEYVDPSAYRPKILLANDDDFIIMSYSQQLKQRFDLTLSENGY